MQSLETKSSRPRPETFETETPKNGSRYTSRAVAILELKKWGGHCGAKKKVGGANINIYLAW